MFRYVGVLAWIMMRGEETHKRNLWSERANLQKFHPPVKLQISVWLYQCFLKYMQADLLRRGKAGVELSIGICHVIDLIGLERKLAVGHSCLPNILFFCLQKLL
ncbi:hypothetical protein ACQJBY_048740 [Aegilops geniculata]